MGPYSLKIEFLVDTFELVVAEDSSRSEVQKNGLSNSDIIGIKVQ